MMMTSSGLTDWLRIAGSEVDRYLPWLKFGITTEMVGRAESGIAVTPQPDGAIYNLDITTALTDADGSETLSVTVTVPQGVTDLIAGRIDLMVANLGAAIPQVQSKRLRALAVTGGARWPLLPDTPTMKESGLPSYEWTFWNAAWLPANTPHDIVTRMNEWINTALDRPRVKDYLLNSGSTAFGTSPAELMKFQIAEHDKWRKVILAAKISAE